MALLEDLKWVKLISRKNGSKSKSLTFSHCGKPPIRKPLIINLSHLIHHLES